MDIYGRRIRLYRNGDTHYHGKMIIILPKQSLLFEQFLHQCCKDINLRVKKIFTIEGVRLRNLNEFVDGGCYVASSGEAFKAVHYYQAENMPVFNVFSRPNMLWQRGKTADKRMATLAPTGGLLTEDYVTPKDSDGIFTAESKAYRIGLFENGDFKSEAVKLTLNHRNCKTFDQLLRGFSALKIVKNGQPRKVYDALSGKRIKKLADIENGINLVLSAFDTYKRGPYKTIAVPRVSTGIGKKEHEEARIITVFPNGDVYSLGLAMCVSKKTFPTLGRLLEKADQQIEIMSGKAKRIYSVDGTLITHIDQLKKKGKYVLVANNDPFLNLRYDRLALQRPATRGLQGHTLNNEYVKMIRPITTIQDRKRKQQVVTAMDPNEKNDRVVGDGMENEPEALHSREQSRSRQPSQGSHPRSSRAQSGVSKTSSKVASGSSTKPENSRAQSNIDNNSQLDENLPPLEKALTASSSLKSSASIEKKRVSSRKSDGTSLKSKKSVQDDTQDDQEQVPEDEAISGNNNGQEEQYYQEDEQAKEFQGGNRPRDQAPPSVGPIPKSKSKLMCF